ncbi:MAG: hypothetical protein V4663_17540 [Bacteroidota bacterium]
MNKHLYLFTVGFFYAHSLVAQVNHGARLTAMGNNGAAVKDIWGVAVNPAAIAYISSPMIQITQQEHFFTNEIRNQALVVAIPFKNLVFGLGLQRYGISAFQNNKVGIVITKAFGPKLAIGLRANYNQLKISNYGATVGISVDLGTIYQLTDELCLGFYINNLTKEAYRTKTIHTSLPTAAYFGIAYRTSDKLLIASTISKGVVATGIDYQLIKAFSIRSGLSLNPFTHYFGLGFNPLKFLIDFAFTKHPNFGYSPQLTIGYVF